MCLFVCANRSRAILSASVARKGQEEEALRGKPDVGVFSGTLWMLTEDEVLLLLLLTRFLRGQSHDKGRINLTGQTCC